ncbi:MAG: hypothetical protein Q8M16_21440 [Pirellulaceae bacterium]|nr:hypothetical protein [Pirellulaceae bacterium]
MNTISVRHCSSMAMVRLAVVTLFFGTAFLGSGSVFGSCGHYVFTRIQWNTHQNHQTLHVELLNTQLSSFSPEIAFGWTGVSLPKSPCHGPGCRQQELPTPIIVLVPIVTDQPDYSGRSDVEDSLEVPPSVLEFYVAQQVSRQGVSQRMFRPPRV